MLDSYVLNIVPRLDNGKMQQSTNNVKNSSEIGITTAGNFFIPLRSPNKKNKIHG